MLGRGRVTGDHAVSEPGPPGAPVNLGGVNRRILTLLTALVEGLSSRWLSGQLGTADAQRLVRAGADAILHTARTSRVPGETLPRE